MPEALMARTTSPGPGAGSGNSCSSSFRSPRKTTPRMMMIPPVEVVAALRSARLVDEPGGGDVLDGESERFEYRGLGGADRLRAVEDLPSFGMDLGLGQDDVSGFLEGRLPGIYHQYVGHGVIVQLAPRRTRRAHGIDVGAPLEPSAFQNRLRRVRRGHDHVRPSHGRLRIHGSRAMLAREALGVPGCPAPHAHLVEAAH